MLARLPDNGRSVCVVRTELNVREYEARNQEYVRDFLRVVQAYGM